MSKLLMMKHMMSYMSNICDLLKIIWHIPGTYHYAFLQFLIPAISALAGLFGNRPSTQQQSGYQDLSQTGQSATTSGSAQNTSQNTQQQQNESQRGSSTSQTSGTTSQTGTTSQAGTTSQTGATAGTAAPILLPEAQTLLSQLTQGYSNLLQNPADLGGYETQGLNAINQASNARDAALNNLLAARGIRGTGAGSVLAKGIAQRYSDVGNFEANLPLIRQQMTQQNLQ